MMDRNELKEQINTAVNANDDFYDASHIDQITDMIMDLDGFSLENGDNLDSVNEDVFWELIEDTDFDTTPKAYTESEWRA